MKVSSAGTLPTEGILQIGAVETVSVFAVAPVFVVPSTSIHGVMSKSNSVMRLSHKLSNSKSEASPTEEQDWSSLRVVEPDVTEGEGGGTKVCGVGNVDLARTGVDLLDDNGLGLQGENLTGGEPNPFSSNTASLNN